jgi:hypothetical protein
MARPHEYMMSHPKFPYWNMFATDFLETQPIEHPSAYILTSSGSTEAPGLILP